MRSYPFSLPALYALPYVSVSLPSGASLAQPPSPFFLHLNPPTHPLTSSSFSSTPFVRMFLHCFTPFRASLADLLEAPSSGSVPYQTFPLPPSLPPTRVAPCPLSPFAPPTPLPPQPNRLYPSSPTVSAALPHPRKAILEPVYKELLIARAAPICINQF